MKRTRRNPPPSSNETRYPEWLRSDARDHAGYVCAKKKLPKNSVGYEDCFRREVLKYYELARETFLVIPEKRPRKTVMLPPWMGRQAIAHAAEVCRQKKLIAGTEKYKTEFEKALQGFCEDAYSHSLTTPNKR